MIEKKSELDEQLKAVSDKLKADIFVYSGDIDLQGVESIIEITAKPTNEIALLLLCTPGGDAHSAFKIARRLQEQYKKFILFVYGYCKSAGTLIAIGSDEIIMSEYAEFGPLDVQLQEKDEIWRYSSGLNIDESLRTLRAETLRYFKSTMIELVADTGISTKTAAEIATHLAIGFVNPIVSQIDPVRIGEINRAVKIALAYGERLVKKRGNLDSAQLVNLIQGYPDHGFAIDFQEAATIFKKVRKCEGYESDLGKTLKSVLKYPKRDGNALIAKIYPPEARDDSSSKSADVGSAGKTEGKTGKADKATVGEVLSIKSKREPA